MNPTKETETNREGIIYVVTRMNWYWNLATLLLAGSVVDPDVYGGLQHELQHRIVDLYKAILSYQMMSVCSYYRNRFIQFARDAVKFNNWDGSLKDVHDAEGALRQDSADYGSHQANSYLEQLVVIARNLEAKLLGSGDHPKGTSSPPQRHWVVPFDRNTDFVGREAILARVLERIPPAANKDACQRTAIEGLGGGVGGRRRLLSRPPSGSVTSTRTAPSSGFPPSTPRALRTRTARLAADSRFHSSTTTRRMSSL